MTSEDQPENQCYYCSEKENLTPFEAAAYFNAGPEKQWVCQKALCQIYSTEEIPF